MKKLGALGQLYVVQCSKSIEYIWNSGGGVISVERWAVVRSQGDLWVMLWSFPGRVGKKLKSAGSSDRHFRLIHLQYRG